MLMKELMCLAYTLIFSLGRNHLDSECTLRFITPVTSAPRELFCSYSRLSPPHPLSPPLCFTSLPSHALQFSLSYFIEQGEARRYGGERTREGNGGKARGARTRHRQECGDQLCECRFIVLQIDVNYVLLFYCVLRFHSLA